MGHECVSRTQQPTPFLTVSMHSRTLIGVLVLLLSALIVRLLLLLLLLLGVALQELSCLGFRFSEPARPCCLIVQAPIPSPRLLDKSVMIQADKAQDHHLSSLVVSLGAAGSSAWGSCSPFSFASSFSRASTFSVSCCKCHVCTYASQCMCDSSSCTCVCASSDSRLCASDGALVDHAGIRVPFALPAH